MQMLKIKADDLPRFMTCNGSRLMPAATPPDDDNTARDEGTAAHYMATAAFNGTPLETLVDRKAPNGVIMTNDMAQHVAAYLDQYGWNANDHARPDQPHWQAMEVDTSHDRSPIWVIDGRADFIKQYDIVLKVADFKYGWRLVEPENNWTLISHAIGFLKRSTLPPPTYIEFDIFQPRPHHPNGPARTWRISHLDLMMLYNDLNSALTHPRDELATSGHCHKCQAIALCPAARAAEMNAIDATSTVFTDSIDNTALSFTLDNLNRAKKLLSDRLDAFEELAKHRIKSGVVVDNYSCGISYGHTRFKDGIDAELLKVLTGKDLSTAKLVTPAEAKRRGVNEDVLKSITERLPTGVKLERVSANKKAAKMFSGDTTKGS